MKVGWVVVVVVAVDSCLYGGGTLFIELHECRPIFADVGLLSFLGLLQTDAVVR